MTDLAGLRWPLWMAPARLAGRLRPTLRATAMADAIALRMLPRAFYVLGLPMLAIVLAGLVSYTHATAGLLLPSNEIDWLRIHVDDVFTESPVFLLGAIVIGVFSPALGVLLVVVFAVMDLAAAAVQPYELVPLGDALAGRLVGIWLLWLLVVEIPVLGRVLGSSVRGLASSRVAVAAMTGLATGVFTFLWTQAAAVLLRPVFTWSSIPTGVRLEAVQPIQEAGIVFAFAAAAVASTVALLRPGQLLHPVMPRPRAIQASSSVTQAMDVVKRIVVAALLTIGLGGLIETVLDAAVLFVALAGARPLARWIASRNPIGSALGHLPPIVRVAIALVLVFGVAYLTVGFGAFKGLSEFFSVIAAVAVGLFIIELVTASGPDQQQMRPSVIRAAGSGTALGLALVALGIAAPLPALADNCASFTDCWSTLLVAATAAAAIPWLLWAASRNPPDRLVGGGSWPGGPPPGSAPPPPEEDAPPGPTPPPAEEDGPPGPTPDEDYPVPPEPDFEMTIGPAREVPPEPEMELTIGPAREVPPPPPGPPPPPPEPDADYPPYPTPPPPGPDEDEYPVPPPPGPAPDEPGRDEDYPVPPPPGPAPEETGGDQAESAPDESAPEDAPPSEPASG